jgi:hypothetical protein
MTLITKKFTNQRRMKELKDLQKDSQKKLKENKEDLKKMGHKDLDEILLSKRMNL